MSGQSTESHAAASVVEDEIVRSGTILHVRLRQTISSFGSKQDTPISAIVIQPVQVDGVIFVPMNTELRGTITRVRRVGVGLSHETAQLNLHFDTLILPGVSPQAIAGRDEERSKVIDDLWLTRLCRWRELYRTTIGPAECEKCDRRYADNGWKAGHRAHERLR